MKTKPNAPSFQEIKLLMLPPTPIEITPRQPQEDLEEDREVYGYLTDSEHVKYSQETGHVP